MVSARQFLLGALLALGLSTSAEDPGLLAEAGAAGGFCGVLTRALVQVARLKAEVERLKALSAVALRSPCRFAPPAGLPEQSFISSWMSASRSPFVSSLSIGEFHLARTLSVKFVAMPLTCSRAMAHRRSDSLTMG